MPEPERDRAIEHAADKVVQEWDRWLLYLEDIGVEIPWNGSAPFASAIGALRRALA